MKSAYELFETLKSVCKNVRPDEYQEFIRLNPENRFSPRNELSNRQDLYLRRCIEETLTNGTGDELIETLNFVGGFIYGTGTNLGN